MISSGLARGARLLGQHVALALDRGRIDAADVERLRIGRGDMHGELLAEGRELAGVAGRFQRRPARRSCPGPGAGVVDIADDHALTRPSSLAMRRSVMFSPIVAISSVMASATLLPSPPSGAAASASTSPASSAWRGDLAHEALELLVAGDEIGLGIDLDQRRRACPRRRRRPGPRRRRGRPSWRRRQGPSCAASRRRLRCRPAVSPSAFLQSIMPAPVFSRSSLTSAAVISAMTSILPYPRVGGGPPPERRPDRSGLRGRGFPADGFRRRAAARPAAPPPRRHRRRRRWPPAAARRAPPPRPDRNRVAMARMASSLPGIG